MHRSSWAFSASVLRFWLANTRNERRNSHKRYSTLVEALTNVFESFCPVLCHKLRQQKSVWIFCPVFSVAISDSKNHFNLPSSFCVAIHDSKNRFESSVQVLCSNLRQQKSIWIICPVFCVAIYDRKPWLPSSRKRNERKDWPGELSKFRAVVLRVLFLYTSSTFYHCLLVCFSSLISFLQHVVCMEFASTYIYRTA